MRIGLYADPHFSSTSSIITGCKGKLSGRLDNLIKSFSWMNQLFKDQQVDEIVCLGDVTDKPVLSAEELTAMSQCGLEDHWIVLGNHCRTDVDGEINSLSLYKKVINQPRMLFDDVYVLPYSRDLIDLNNLEFMHPRIILSHNDIKGYNFGNYISTEGYDINKIMKVCDLFINGHLHNGGWIVPGKMMNLGVLSGINFSSCSGEWEPSCAILDTETLKIELFENPEAYRFKKVSFNTLSKVKGFLDNLPEDSYNVVQFKVPKTLADKTRKLVNQNNKIVASRIITYEDNSIQSEELQEIPLNSTKSIYELLKEFITEQETSLSKLIIQEIIDVISEQEEGVV